MKRFWFLLFSLLFLTQIFVSLDTKNIFPTNFNNESINDTKNIYINVADNARIGATTIVSNNKHDTAPQVEALKVTKTKVLFDIQKSNVGKIVFLSVCAVIIITVVIVLTIKIHNSGKK